MDQTSALTIFCSALAVLGGVWLIGTVFAFSRTKTRAVANEYAEPGREARDGVTGRVAVHGTPARLVDALVDRLTRPAQGRPGPLVRITERTANAVTFERAGGTGIGFDSGRVVFDGSGSEGGAAYTIEFGRFNRLMRTVVALVCFAYGGLFVAGTPLLIWYLVLGSEDPGVRWQVIQMLQMVHGVWPPFLVGFLVGRVRSTTVTQFEALLASLEHVS